jgi:GntR family transcriptional regulator
MTDTHTRRWIVGVRCRSGAGELDEHSPTDQELAEAYGASRHTVREAVRRLADDGLLARERGRGTRVRTVKFERTAGTLEGLFEQGRPGGHADRRGAGSVK